MAVSGTAKEIVEARERSTDEDGTRTYRRRFLVTCTEANDDANVALQAAGLPQRYFSYATDSSYDAAARCTEITAKQVSGSYLLWHVDVTYSTKHGDQQKEQQEGDNPLLALPEFEFSHETIQVPIYWYPDQTVAASTAPGHKISGPIMTSAGEVFDPAPTMDESRPVVVIRRNESTINNQIIGEYQNVVNSDYVFGNWAPRTVKLRSLTAQSQTTKGVFYWQVTYVLAFRREGWDLRIANYGSQYLTTAGATDISYFKTKDGSPRYGFLKTDGTACALPLATSDIIQNALTFRIHVEKPFAVLNLPLSPNR